jgi:plastocyanin
MSRKNILALILALSLSLPTAGLAAAGEIKGVVKPQGLRSPEGVLVYLSNGPAAKLDLSGGKFVMDQQNLTFIPHVLPVPVGAKVSFPNNDKVSHNVFSLSQAKKFNLGSYKPGQSADVTFDKPGVVELRCDVHQDMKAYILVLKSPYYALTDAQGKFTIPDPKLLASQGIKGAPPLPAGKYLVKTWHEKLRGSHALAEVPATGAVEVTLKPKRGPSGVLYKR